MVNDATVTISIVFRDPASYINVQRDRVLGSRGCANWRVPAQPRAFKCKRFTTTLPLSPIWPSNLRSATEPVRHVGGDRAISYILLVKELKYKMVTLQKLHGKISFMVCLVQREQIAKR